MGNEETKIEQSHQVFIGEKNGMTAVIALDINPYGTCLGRLDSRNDPPVTLTPCDSPEMGKALFEKSINTSIKNGWRIAYRGERNRG